MILFKPKMLLISALLSTAVVAQSPTAHCEAVESIGISAVALGGAAAALNLTSIIASTASLGSKKPSSFGWQVLGRSLVTPRARARWP